MTPEPLNARYFVGSQWFNAARGTDPHATGWPEYNGGIDWPRRVHLKVGQRYFRFANSKADRERSQFGGPWWVEYETLREIVNYCRAFSTPREAVRYLLSIPWEWSEVDKLVHAILEKPLDAFRGTGRLVQSKLPTQVGAHLRDHGTRYIPPQHLYIPQLYIPGLHDPNVPPGHDPAEIRKMAFPQPHIEDIWTSSYFR